MPVVLMPALVLLVVSIWLRWGPAEGRALLRQMKPTLAALAIGAIALPFVLSQVYGAVHALVVVALLGALGVAVSTLQWAAGRLRGGGLGASGLGMVLAHMGVAFFVVGVAMVKGYGIEHDVSLAPGGTHTLAGCKLHFDRMSERTGPNYQAQAGHFTLRCGEATHELVSEKRTYVGSGMPLSQSAIDWGLTRDFYVALSTPTDDAGTTWSMRVQYKPFVRFIWLGVLLMGAGALSAALARRLRRKAERRDAAAMTPALGKSLA
jgi:cytochrome c-type biogenesis protein CcmF